MIRFLGNMTLSDFISTVAFLVVCWYFLNNQIKKGFQIQGQEIKENGQEIKNILPLVKKEIENNVNIRAYNEQIVVHLQHSSAIKLTNVSIYDVFRSFDKDKIRDIIEKLIPREKFEIILSNIGNVIELGTDDLGDNFGADLLTSAHIPSRPAGSIQSVSAIEKVDDIGIKSLEPMESISFDLPEGRGGSTLPDVFINKEPSSFSNGFSNDQSASGPSINLAAASRLSVEEERKKKIDLINKLNRLEGKGYNLTKRFTMDNALEEIQVEFDRLVDAKNLEASLRFQRQCLMGVVTGAEFMNSKFNPFDWDLDGWSESVHENIEDFDEIFEELYDKYKGRGNMPPEAKLLMSLVGSGFMFHMSS